MLRLIEQVQEAKKTAVKPVSERDVTTIITRPLWEQWCRITEIPPGAKPVPPGQWPCYRVFGSRTIVVESPALECVSFLSP